MSLSMSNSTLSETDKQDICDALAGLKGAQAKSEAQSQADFYGVSYSTICEVSRRVRPERKKRSDAGRRKIQMLENDALKFAAELVANQNLQPELALLTMQENAELFGTVEINLGTFRRYLREHGISRTQAKNNRMPHRNFRADFPGQIYQFDISGVKERWMDIKTRAIHKVSVLEVSKNHANRRTDRVPLWKMTLKDDNSGKKFVRFVACQKPNTIHVVEFLKAAFALFGLPFNLYTDNDAVIKNKRMLRGAGFINESFKESGGFQMIQHLPGNAKATGKVERAHQVVEEYEKLIGVKVEYGTLPNLDGLNRFADWLCDRYNTRPHSTTGIAPNIAFRATTNPKRLINPEQFDAAFKARDLNLKIGADVTITVDGIKYQLSRKDSEPFVQLAAMGARLEVYWIDDDDFFACVTPAGDEYIVQKLQAKADGAFDYKTLPETVAEKTRKELKKSQKERIATVKEAQKQQEAPVLIVPGIDTEIPDRTDTGVIDFPVRTETGDVAKLDELTHRIAAKDRDSSRKIDLFDALELLQSEDLAPRAPGDEMTRTKMWLRDVFSRREFITETELRKATKERQFAVEQRKLRLA